MAWEQEKLKALLEAAGDAIRRARYVFAAINVAGILILSAQFNAYLPWLRNPLTRNSVDPSTKKLINEFFFRDLYSVSVPVLGIKFSVFDLSIVGSTGLAVLAVWLFYCVRRENHVVNAIVREGKAALSENDIGRAAYLYYGIAHNFVFTTITESDVPGGERPKVMVRYALKVLYAIPAWVPLVIVAIDLMSVFLPHKLALTQSSPWADFDVHERVEVVLRSVYCLTVAWFSYIQCHDVARFDADTRSRLNILRERIEPEHLAQSATAVNDLRDKLQI
jgi:hypothetical protein